MKKKEVIFIAAILVLSIVLWAGLNFIRKPSTDENGSIHITVDGKEIGTYSLDHEQTIKIGTTNVCEISNGEIRMTEASCPDHICIQQGAIGTSGGMIVCLPNKVIIEGDRVGSADSAGVDALS